VIVCVHLPRFELAVAAGGPGELAGQPLAIAPTGGGAQRVGEVSGTAQARGVAAGMGLGEALARCPQLVLVPEDPVGVARVWEKTARALESIGAEVELARPGLAYFRADGLRGVHRDTLGVIAAARDAIGRPCRIGAGPARFCSLAATLQARSRRVRIVDEREVRRYLAAAPVSLLAYREQTAPLVSALQQLGIDTLGRLVALGGAKVADRFGAAGTLARALALGEDEPLRVRRVEDRLQESMGLGEANSAEALARTLEVLTGRLLARPERRGRTIGAVMLSARLIERGTWSELVVFRQALANRRRMALALSLRLALLPAPAETLGLAVEQFGPATGDQGTLLDGERTARLDRLADALAQVRAFAGVDGALRVLAVDPESRVPERRYVFTPFSA
jgi:protein ImuB